MNRSKLSTPTLSSFLAMGLLAPGLLLLSAPAFAGEIEDIKASYPPCAKEASSADIDAAATAHHQALEAFDALDYKRAVKLWSQAYEHDCSRPKVFVNIGNAYERDGNKRAALAVYEIYLERDAAEAPERIKDKARILREQVESEDKKAALAAKPAPAPPSEPPPSDGNAPLGVAPWIGLGVGGASMIAGGVLLGVGLSQASSAADACSDPEARTGCPASSVDDGESGETLSQVGQGLLYGGAGLAALSLILQLTVNADAEPESNAPVAFVPGPEHAELGVGLRLRF